jgi:hypothetical protein
VRVGGPRAARHLGHARDDPGRQHDRVGPRVEPVDDLLDRDERALRGEHRLLLHAGEAPQLHVAVAVGALRVDDRHVGAQRGDRGQRLARERARDRPDGGGVPRQVGPGVAAQHRERQVGGAGHVGVRQPGVRVLDELERRGPAALDRVAEAVQRADAGVAAPREDQPAGAAGADQLVVDDVGRQPRQRQVAPALADDLVRGGNGNEVGEALEGHGVAVVHQLGDGVREGGDGGAARHDPLRSYTARTFALRTRRRPVT